MALFGAPRTQREIPSEIFTNRQAETPPPSGRR